MITVAVAIVTTGIVAASLAQGGTYAPSAPSASAPNWSFLTTGVPAAYDAADGYDLWWFPDGSTWTYAHGMWSNVTATAGVPTGMKENVRMVYDAQDGYVVLFGGAVPGSPPRPLAETWTFRGGHWTNLTGSLPGSPPPRLLGVMTYDSEDREVVLFGGSGPNYVATNETWTFVGGRWTNATVPGPPPLGGGLGLSEFYGFVDDPSLGYVVYYDPLGYCIPAVPGCPVLWTFHGGTWTNRTPVISPSLRLLPLVLFAYDSSDGYLVALSACGSTAASTCPREYGTFVFTGSGWKDVTTGLEPPGRNFASWVDDPSDGGVMVAGGCCWGDFSGFSVPWQDVWVFSHGVWTESEPWGGGAPSWWQSDGTWVGVGLLAVAAVMVLARWGRVPRHS